MQKQKCPFNIGDTVVFDPDERVKGWTQDFGVYRIFPGYKGKVTKIAGGGEIYLDDNRGGFHWECFKKD